MDNRKFREGCTVASNYFTNMDANEWAPHFLSRIEKAFPGFCCSSSPKNVLIL